VAGEERERGPPVSEPRKLPADVEARVAAYLTSHTKSFNFFQAVQILHRLRPWAQPVGEAGPARREGIRFVHDPGLVFHPSDLTKIEMRVIRAGEPYIEVTSTFLGLLGAVSPLATFFTEDVLHTDEDDAKTLKPFYDIFHHRLLSLFYRVWKKYRFWAGSTSDGTDAFTRKAVSFVGVVPEAMPGEGLSARQLLSFAPLIASRTRTPRALRLILENVLDGTPVEIESFVARRVLLGPDQIARLGKQNATLGQSFTIGASVMDRSGRFRVNIGPVNEELFEALLPGGAGFATLRQIIDQFSRGILEPEVELKLDEEKNIHFQLGGKAGARLGVTTALPSREKKPTTARFVLSDTPTVARSVLLDEMTRGGA